MTMTSIFPPLPQMPKGIRAMRIDSGLRMKDLRLEMEVNPIRPVRARQRGRISRQLTAITTEVPKRSSTSRRSKPRP